MSSSIAFCNDLSNPFYGAVLKGVRAALEQEPDLALLSWMGSYRFPHAALAYLKPEGLLVGPVTSEQCAALPAGVPAAGFSNRFETKLFPSVVNDDVEVGRLAAEALVNAGYDQLAVLTSGDSWHARQRTCGARLTAEKVGVSIEVADFDLRKLRQDETFQDVWRENRDRFHAFLKALPANTGLIATGEHLAHDAQDLLREELRREMPGDLGLVLADLPSVKDRNLAYVQLDGVEVGRHAMAWLKEALEGRPHPVGEELQIPPLGVQGGATLRPDEIRELYARLEIWCRERLREPVTVEDMCRGVGISRRTLETKLHERGLPSPYSLLTGLRLREAKRLLKESTLRMDAIAEACGFSDARQFRKRFQASEGMPPTAWRASTPSQRGSSPAL